MTTRAVGSVAGLGASFAWMLGGDLANKAIRFAGAIVLARLLSVEDYGVVNVVIAVVGLVVVVSSFGLPDLGAQKVALDVGRTQTLVPTVISIRLLASGAICVLGLGCVAVADIATLPLAACAACMAIAMSLYGDWALRGNELTKTLGLIWLTGGVSLVAGLIVAVAVGITPVLALAAFAFSEMVIAASTLWALRRLTVLHPRLRGARELLGEVWPLAVSAVIVYSYYANVDTLILAATRSTAEAGLYSGPYRIFLVLNVVGVFAAYALSPRLARRSATGGRSFEEASVVLALLASFGLATIGIALLAGEPLLRLTFGPDFARMAPTFVLLCVAVAWYSVGYPVGYSLVAEGRNRAFMAGAATAGAVNLGLNLALIPSFGAVAAGIATAAAFASACVVWLSLGAVTPSLRTALVGTLLVESALTITALLLDEVRIGIACTLLAGAGVIAFLARRAGIGTAES